MWKISQAAFSGKNQRGFDTLTNSFFSVVSQPGVIKINLTSKFQARLMIKKNSTRGASCESRVIHASFWGISNLLPFVCLFVFFAYFRHTMIRRQKSQKKKKPGFFDNKHKYCGIFSFLITSWKWYRDLLFKVAQFRKTHTLLDDLAGSTLSWINSKGDDVDIIRQEQPTLRYTNPSSFV